ncbi:hypothetical protein [Nocardia vinacea]|uniref:hypothetical protein n=1 Tax=Nocardia vinacea TaxID=96468 RepID=UPI000594BF80|nr:hypothetical protein [Nocardia vinacea]
MVDWRGTPATEFATALNSTAPELIRQPSGLLPPRRECRPCRGRAVRERFDPRCRPAEVIPALLDQHHRGKRAGQLAATGQGACDGEYGLRVLVWSALGKAAFTRRAGWSTSAPPATVSAY